MPASITTSSTRRFYRRLRAIVAWCVRHRVIVVALTLGALVASLLSFAFIPQHFFPHLQPAGNPRRPVAAGGHLRSRRSKREAKALEAQLLEDPDMRLRRHLIGEGAPRFYLPLDQQLATRTSPSCC